MPFEALRSAAELTTQEAADALNVSQPHLLSLLESGEIPFHISGSHRRVRSSDLQKYRARRDQKRRKVLNNMTRQAHKQGLNWAPVKGSRAGQPNSGFGMLQSRREVVPADFDPAVLLKR